MATIVLRIAKGSPLSSGELDSNFSNINSELITKLPSASYTAADVLSKILSVDGSGSGLDADLLDGLNTSTTLPLATNKSSVVSRDASGNFSANLINATITVANNLSGVNSNGFISKIGVDSQIARIIIGTSGDISVANGDGISGNPVISIGTNLARRDSINSYSLTQTFALITANAVSNDGNNNLYTGANNLSTTSTNGFIYVPTITGTPTGVPTTNAGRSAIVWDTSSNKLWVYSGGLWNPLINQNSVNIFTARQRFSGNQPGVIGDASANLGAVEVFGSGGAAYMAFHRPGQFATYFGLDSDNQFKFGGWSAGSVAQTFLHSGNYVNLPVNSLNWKNFGAGHIIADVSNGLSPSGTAVDRNNAQIRWSTNYPTLMGWNGTNTYGVRVDSALVADFCSTGFGNDQSWKSMIGSRGLNTGHGNNSGRPILVVVNISSSSGVVAVSVSINGVSIHCGSAVVNASHAQITFVVPSGVGYSVTTSGGIPNLLAWAELN